MEKQETIFRQKSVDRVSSPEQLDNYLKVTSPSVWLILIGIIIILVGAIAWGAFGKLPTYSVAGCVVEDGIGYCYIKETEGLKVEKGMTVEIPSEEATFSVMNIQTQGIQIPDSYSYLQHLVGVTAEDYVFCVSGLTNLPAGYYSGKVITEEVSPLEFILN